MPSLSTVSPLSFVGVKAAGNDKLQHGADLNLVLHEGAAGCAFTRGREQVGRADRIHDLYVVLENIGADGQAVPEATGFKARCVENIGAIGVDIKGAVQADQQLDWWPSGVPGPDAFRSNRRLRSIQ